MPSYVVTHASEDRDDPTTRRSTVGECGTVTFAAAPRCRTKTSKEGIYQAACALIGIAFHADCAGSIPVTRSTGLTRETVHRYPATPLLFGRFAVPA
jgi:hypothetical protein